MIKKVFCIGLLSIAFLSTTFAFKQQWFQSFSETTEGLSFLCTQQCIILFDTPRIYDQLSLKWSLQWDGKWAYGFLIGNQFAALWEEAWGQIEKNINLRENPLFTQLPKENAVLWIVFQGNVSTTLLQITATNQSFAKKITQWFYDFFTNEPLRPYSINLRYGITILWTPLVKIMYRLFIIGLIIIVTRKTSFHQKKQWIISLAIILMLLFGIRNLFNRISRTNTWLQQYTFQADNQKIFFDLGDYIVFTKKMRETLDLDTKVTPKKECKIFIDTSQDRPFGAHWEMLYLKPCERTTEKPKADYVIVYKKAKEADDEQKKILLEFNGSFLLSHKQQ